MKRWGTHQTPSELLNNLYVRESRGSRRLSLGRKLTRSPLSALVSDSLRRERKEDDLILADTGQSDT